jgi:hypothetical protein
MNEWKSFSEIPSSCREPFCGARRDTGVCTRMLVADRRGIGAAMAHRTGYNGFFLLNCDGWRSPTTFPDISITVSAQSGTRGAIWPRGNGRVNLVRTKRLRAQAAGFKKLNGSRSVTSASDAR